MINLSYKFVQNSSSLELNGMPDVSNGDSENTIGILSSWTLKIIDSPTLEGEKEHLEDLMQVILQYSRSYISGIRETFISKKSIVTISPFGSNHKLLLNSTKNDVKPLEIILDDSELSDLTQCLDLLRFDSRFNLCWNIPLDKPFSKKYIKSFVYKSNKRFNLFYAFVLFLSTSSLMLLIPTNNKFDLNEPPKSSQIINE
ncbi:DUF4335 domain-containing protein [Prochlorococcus sp. MIT 0801]|uniref:DUF4335 domain-containing protein n=1 Tax=Prochlorococcus sp. MIT 0801 TaxID=1501269 RepID=UPI0004F877E8|nr:DUF4335 domain-containing protein [Prochlorococcus sp. MIT 0801]AIQ97163.1 hypothetical protein EW15_1071 [Prochlorococcus sp. MIT 0801]